MAVLDILPGVEVAVTVNGLPLKEYTDHDQEEPTNTVTRYIEAVSGTEFAINFKAAQSTVFKGDCLTAKVFMDGHKVSSTLLKQSRCCKRGASGRIDYTRISADKCRKFKFSSLETTDKYDTTDSKDLKVKDLGVIAVEMHHKWEGEKRRPTVREVDLTGPGVIPEKALKGQALSHSISFGVEQEVPKRTYRSTIHTSTHVGDPLQSLSSGIALWKL